ncbi:MAG: O-antigen ligase family protein [Cyanobium sp.]
MGRFNSSVSGMLQALRSECPSNCRDGGWICVQLALLLLPSSALLAGVLLLIAITWQRPVAESAPFSRTEARLLLLLSVLMVIGNAWAVTGWVAWIGLFNWLPFFWLFLAIRPYLSTLASRARLGNWFLAGTVPVIAVTLAQRITGHERMLQTLWGLIAWPMRYPARGGGMFENPNVTAAWIAIALPFLLSACLKHHKSLIRSSSSVAITIAAHLALFVNASRNAIATVPAIWFLSAGRRGQLGVLLACAIYSGLFALKLHQSSIPSGLSQALDLLVPDLLVQKLQTMTTGDAALPAMTANAYYQRPAIYAGAFSYIAAHPWVGLGENGFSMIYSADTMRIHGVMPLGPVAHSHNVLLEFAVSHGLPALALLVAVVGRPVLLALPLLRTRHQASDRAWLLATLTMLWLEMWDLPSFDSRINIAAWLLLAAMAEITRPKAPQATSFSSPPNGPVR